MSFTRCSHLAAILAISAFSLPAQQAADAPPAPHDTLPQIVRLSLVEGDVRVARGKHDEKLTGNTWEQAASGIPLQSGFSLATGANGYAEIEFEDASTIYLAPNTALSLPKLTARDGVPSTNLSLLSGTITLNLKLNVPGDTYRIETPTYGITLNNGDSNYSRITSYLDGLHITPMEDTHLVLNKVNTPVPAGTTYTLTTSGAHKTRTLSGFEFVMFDAWVKQRVASRDAAMKSVMEQAGLKTPVPGLADLAGKGTFVPCEPYGTCWQPADGWVPKHSGQPAPVHTSQVQPTNPAPQPRLVLASLQLPTAQTGGTIYPYDSYDDLYDELADFPCNPYAFWSFQQALYYPAEFYPYDWAVCHAGFWIYRQNRYLWVAGTHKHHHCPVHWVKFQGKLGFVPDHPRDRPGAVPVNLRHGIYALSERPGHPVERIAFDGKAPPKLIDGTPKEFRDPAPPRLARADAPEVGVHFMHDTPNAAGEIHSGSRTTTSSLRFDQHSNRFMLATSVTEGGHTHTFTEPMSNRGGHIASASAGGFHSGYASNGAPVHAGSAGGGFHGGGGGSSSHAGGGGSSGGGGSHGGGGGGGSSGGGGGASSGGGGHH